MEIWKDIPGYEGLYKVSSHGRIMGVGGRVTYSARHGRRVWAEKIMKPKACQNYSKCGYRVTLWQSKKPKDYLVARLVAVAFLGNSLDTKLTVNHKDGDRLNNNIDNLEWLTLSQNILYGFANGQFPQNETILKNLETGKAIKFRSQSIASAAIGRNAGYVSLCLKKSRTATGIDGTKYAINSTRKGGSKNK